MVELWFVSNVNLILTDAFNILLNRRGSEKHLVLVTNQRWLR